MALSVPAGPTSRKLHLQVELKVFNELKRYDIEGREVVAYKQKVGLDWTLVVQQDTSEAYAPTRQSQIKAIITIIFTAGACIGIIILLSRIISKPLQSARNETDNILSAANDGLFLINKDYTIGSQQSANLKEILRHNDLEGYNFLHYLTKSVPLDLSTLAKEYIDLLFSKRIKEQLIESRNPLKEVPVSIPNKHGFTDTHYLSITFKRIYKNNEIESLFVTAKDVTKEVLLRRELDRANEDKQEQISLLSDIIHIPYDHLRGFLDRTQKTLKEINMILEKPGSAPEMFKNKVSAIYKHMHKIKGDASFINFELMIADCHRFEDILTDIKNKSTIKSGYELLPIALELEKLFSRCNMITGLMHNLSTMKSVGSSGESSVTGGEWDQLEQMAEKLSAKYEKPVDIHFKGFKREGFDQYKQDIKDIAIQLIRNSFAHGLESPSVRISAGKIEFGQITLILKSDHKGNLKFIYMDDGGGIDRVKAVNALEKKGSYSRGELEKMTDAQINHALLFSDVSTQEHVDHDAGRGVGMSLVLSKVKALKGNISLKNKPGRYLAFIIKLPSLS